MWVLCVESPNTQNGFFCRYITSYKIVVVKNYKEKEPLKSELSTYHISQIQSIASKATCVTFFKFKCFLNFLNFLALLNYNDY